MGRTATANEIINRAALEVGLQPVSDPVGSSDEAFIQLTGLLNAAGQELVELHPWQTLTKDFNLTTQPGDSGSYVLPDDYSYMADQTGWDRTNRVFLGGPLSTQDISYLKGRDLVSSTIYASFRINNDKLELFPSPPPEGLQISFIYISRYWIREQIATDNNRDIIGTGSDRVMYEPILAVKFLKAKFLEAKGFDSSAARVEFENMMLARKGHDEGGQILSASRGSRHIPYISPYHNTGDSGFGS